MNRANKQNSFNNKHIKFFSEISSDSESKNNSTNSNKNTLNYKGRKQDGRNNSKLSYYSTNCFNIKTNTVSLNHSYEHIIRNKKKNSIIIYDNTLNTILKNIYYNQSPNLTKLHSFYRNNGYNNSLPIKRKKTETCKSNKLIFSSIIIPSKIKKKLIFDNSDPNLLPPSIKNEIKNLKTMNNINIKG